MSSQRPENLDRMLRQRLESLRRAGLDRVPLGVDRGLLERLRERPPAVSEPAVAIPRKTPPVAPASPPPPPAASGSLFGDDALEAPAVPADARLPILEALSEEVAGCVRCPELVANRSRTVFGTGNVQTRLMFIGEAPGADEDRQGVPFVGRAGQLLTDMITKGMGLRRSDVYIANILKCRPPDNRDPLPAEAQNCIGYLERQIATIRPEYLCLLGRIAAQTLLDTSLPMGRLRGKWHRCRGVATLVTYHPAALLRNPAWKKDAWEDLQMLMRAMGLKVPERKRD